MMESNLDEDEDEDKTDLELSTSDELLAELQKRFPSMVFVAEPTEGENYSWRLAYIGDTISILGLIEIAKTSIIKVRLHDRETEIKEDEEEDGDA